MIAIPTSLWSATLRLSGGAEWPPRDASEAARFIEYANRDGVFDLLVAQSDHPATVAQGLDRFRALEALHRRRYELSRVALNELIRIAGPDSFLLLKGSDYRFRLYPDPVLRPAGDIDIFVPANLRRAVIARLADSGHGEIHSSRGAAWTPWHYEYRCVIGGVLIEIHRGFIQNVRARVRYEDVWARKEAFQGDGYRAFRPGPNDALVNHAISLAKDEFSAPLIRYVDMYLFLQRPECDLLHCTEIAREWQTESALYGALKLTTLLFPDLRDTQVERATSALLTERRRTFLSRRVLPDPRFESSGHTGGRTAQLWRKFWLMDAPWRRIAFPISFLVSTVIGYAREWIARRTVESQSLRD